MLLRTTYGNGSQIFRCVTNSKNTISKPQPRHIECCSSGGREQESTLFINSVCNYDELGL